MATCAVVQCDSALARRRAPGVRLDGRWSNPATEQISPVSAKFIEAVSDFEIIKPERAVVNA
jgi:hypothetical protein